MTSDRSAAKKDAILNEAARLFNKRGIGTVKLTDVASKLGVGRATLYHYVANREDLVLQCFERSCNIDKQRLKIAAEQSNGLEQVLSYVRQSLTPDGTETAIITDLGFLSESAQSIIANARVRNHKLLAQMIERGIDEGVIRPCDHQILARVICSMLVFCHSAQRWAPSTFKQVDSDAIVDFITQGSAKDTTLNFQCEENISNFSRLEAAGFDRDSVNRMRVEQILMTASGLFNRRGIENVSLDDVVAELGATKGAFYHYFKSKKSLLEKCVERGNRLYYEFVDAAEQSGRNGLEKNAIVSHLNIQAQCGDLQPLSAWTGLDVLPPTQRKKHQQRLRSLLDRTSQFSEEGIKDGSRRKHDMASVTIARAGAYQGIPVWLSELDNRPAQKIADEIVDFFHKGLKYRT
jgi:AcrR family transcriptional regulator